MHARSLCGEILDLLAEILMVGLADGGLEFGMAELAAKMAETGTYVNNNWLIDQFEIRLINQLCFLSSVVSGNYSSQSQKLKNKYTHIQHAHTHTASASSLLPSLSKLLYQLSEAGGKCEVEGIRSDGSLRPTALLLEKMLSLLQNMAETDTQEFDKVCEIAVLAKRGIL